MIAWWRERSPWAKARAREARRAALLASLSLAQADAALAALVGDQPLVAQVGEEPDAYTDAFVARYLGWGSRRVRVVESPRIGGERVVAVLFPFEDHEQDEVFVRSGSWVAEESWGQRFPTVAHLFLHEVLSDDELEALVAGEPRWLTARSRLDRVVPVAATRAFELDRRSRAGTAVVSLLLGCAGAAVLAANLWVFGRAPWSHWCAWTALGATLLALAGLLARQVWRDSVGSWAP